MVLTTLIVTFTVIVGLALAVLYSVAGPPLRARGSRLIAVVDGFLQRVAHRLREGVRRGRERVAAHHAAVQHRAAVRDERKTAHLH